ncbi:hypothetical protein LI165_12095, partial [Phascolarctobacterium faecium]
MKKIFLFCSVLPAFALPLISIPVAAADKYVSDVIYIPVRSDKNPQSAILQQGVASDTKLNFIREETGADNNLWSLVIT